jgi:hypothetical protein
LILSNNKQGLDITIGIMAKYPEEGKVKTRLVPPLTYRQATGLYEAVLLDTIETISKLDACYKKVIFYYPENEGTYFNDITGPDWLVLPQSGKDLGERLKNAFLEFEEDGSRVMIIGSDSPVLPVQYLIDSGDLLSDNDIVLGPTEDGGFYSIAIKDISRTFIEDIFKNIKWSTSHTLSDIVENIKIVNKKFALGGRWYDVDTSKDIERLTSESESDDIENYKNIKQFISKYL